MNLDFLKPVLGDELFWQIADKLKGSGIQLANIADGSYIPKAKFDEQLDKVKTLQSAVSERDEMIKVEKSKNIGVDTLQAKITALEKDVADRDTKIHDIVLDGRIRDAVRNYKARDVNVVMPLLKRDAIGEKDGELTGVNEQLEALQKSHNYLFDIGGGGGRVGFDGGQDIGGQPKSENAVMNQALRAAAGRA